MIEQIKSIQNIFTTASAVVLTDVIMKKFLSLGFVKYFLEPKEEIDSFIKTIHSDIVTGMIGEEEEV